jgi:hypothetical protein
VSYSNITIFHNSDCVDDSYLSNHILQRDDWKMTALYVILLCLLSFVVITWLLLAFSKAESQKTMMHDVIWEYEEKGGCCDSCAQAWRSYVSVHINSHAWAIATFRDPMKLYDAEFLQFLKDRGFHLG